MPVGPNERLLVSKALLKLEKAFDFLETVQSELKVLVAEEAEDMQGGATLGATAPELGSRTLELARERERKDWQSSRLVQDSNPALAPASVPERRGKVALGDVVRPELRDEPPDHYLRLCMQNNDPSRKAETIQKLTEEEARDEIASHVWVKSICGFKVPIFHPETPAILHWMLVGMCFIIYEVFVTPYRLCFQVPAEIWGPWFFVEATINLYFLADLVMQFLIGFFDETGHLVTKHSAVATKYLFSWFLFDFLAALPFDWIMFTVDAEKNAGGPTSPGRLLRIFRAVRFLKLARLLRLARLRRVFDKVEMELESSMAKLFGFQVMKILVFLCGVAHLAACFWYYVGMTSEDEFADVSDGPQDDRISWIHTEGKAFHEATTESKFKMWLWALHYVTATMTTVGYGDVHPTNTTEVIYTLLLLWISIIVFSGCLGILMALINSIYDSSQKRRQKLVDVAKYLRWRAVPRGLRSNIRQYLCFVWENNEDAEDLESFVMSQLSPTLRADLSYHVFGRVLGYAPFLAWLTDVPVVLKTLSMSTTSRFYEAGDTLFSTGEVNTSIFFLISGWIEVLVGSLLPAGWSADDLALQGAFLDAAIQDPEAMAANFQVSRRRADGKGLQKGEMGLLPRSVTKSTFSKALANPLYESAKNGGGGGGGGGGGTASDERAAARARLKAAASGVDEAGESTSFLGGEKSPAYVEAPAFFGESCVWALDQTMPKPALYTASCYRRSEFATLSLGALKQLVANFPFLFDKYVAYRRHVFEVYNGPLPKSDEMPQPDPGPESPAMSSARDNARDLGRPRLRQKDVRREGARKYKMAQDHKARYGKTIDQSQRYLPQEELPEPYREPPPGDYPAPPGAIPGDSPRSREGWPEPSPEFSGGTQDLEILRGHWKGPLQGNAAPKAAAPGQKMVLV